MKNIFRKSIVAVVILGILIMSLAPQQSLAQQSNILSNVSKSTCLPLPGFFQLIGCISATLAFAVYVAFIFVGWLVGIAGNALNFVLGMAINNKFYVGVGPIAEGWAFTRDITNIFFIFSFLFIAIATILGLESYGAKKLLARLIIIALLVNFSLLATQAIIFITNAVAFELYSAISVTKNSWVLGSSERGFDKDLTGALMQGLIDQKIFNSDPRTLIVGPAAGQPTSSSRANTNIAVLVTLLGGTIILLFAGFIFLAGAFFFAVRIVMLWLLMILAPFGFVFLILPATQEYAKKWWAALQSQALFAPAFLFFFLITIKMAQSDLLKIVQKATTSTTTELLFLLIVQNLVILLLLGGGLLIAKQLGIYGAAGAMSMAQKGGKAFGRFAGRGAAAPFKWGGKQALKGGGAVSQRVIGALPTGKWYGRFAAKPFAAISGAAEKQKEEYKKQIQGLNSTQFAAAYHSTVNPLQRKEMLQAAAEAGKLDKLSTSDMRGAYDAFKNNPSEAKAYNNVVKARPDLIESDASLSPTDKRARMTDALSRMSEKDIEEKLGENVFDPANALTHEMMILTWGEREMTAAIRKHGNEAKSAVQAGITRIGGGMPANMFDQLYRNNKNLLRGLFTNPALSSRLSALRTQMAAQARAQLGHDWQQQLRV